MGKRPNWAKVRSMRILVALDGDSLTPRGGQGEAELRRRQAERAAVALAGLAAEHELVVVPDSPAATAAQPPRQLLELALRNALPGREVVTVLTEVVVSPDAADFDGPPRPVEPHAIAELRSLRALVGSGAVVVCAGGGSPVTVDGAGRMRGVEVVVDADLTAALLARRLEADLLLMLSDAGSIEAEEAKVAAARRFVDVSGRRAAVGALADAARIVRGQAGTQLRADAATAPCV